MVQLSTNARHVLEIVNGHVAQHLSASSTHQDKTFSYHLWVVDLKCEGYVRHTIMSCIYRRLISFSHRFVNTGMTRLVCGKWAYTSRNSVMSLVATLRVSRSYEVCDVNVVLLAAL
jgi:hypothetical protein